MSLDTSKDVDVNKILDPWKSCLQTNTYDRVKLKISNFISATEISGYINR